MIRRPPRSTLLPYTTLFRSEAEPVEGVGDLLDAIAEAHRRGGGVGDLLQEAGELGLDLAEQRPARIGGKGEDPGVRVQDRKSTRLNSSHANNLYAAFCLTKN